MPTNDPNGLQYMLGGAKYGLNSPFITSNNPPAPSTANKLGYLGLSGTNSATYTPPPAGTATVDNPGVFVPSQPLVENQGVRQQPNADGTFNWVATAPGNVGTTAARQGINGTTDPYALSRTTQGTATGTTNGSINGSIDPFGISRKNVGKAPALPNTTLPQPDGTMDFISPRDNVIDAMAQRQRPNLSMYSPLRGLFNIGNR